MAVRVNNTANIRKAQRWDERDDAALCVLLKRKLKDVNIALRESNSPYERSRLKEQKRHYKSMLKKVENGVYNGDIIFGELQAASALRSEQTLRSAELSTMAGGKRYVNSYQAMDFDYESAFRKKRYYGVALPLVMLILSLAFVAIFIISAFLPSGSLEISLSKDNKIVLDSLFSYKLTDEVDIYINNTAKDMVYPRGIYTKEKPQDGTQYKPDEQSAAPSVIGLHADLGMTAVYISPFDVVKAWFRTPMLKDTKIDFLEDSKYFQGNSYYYLALLSGDKGEALVIKKDADGNYDWGVIMRHIGTYGTIIFLIAAFLLGIVNIIINIVRLFTYTSRRLHAVTFINFLISLLCMLAPAFATVEGTEIGAAFSAYFSAISGNKAFMDNADATVGIGILFLIPVAINFIMMLLPFFFRNRLKKQVSYVPKGNRKRSAFNDPLYADEETLKRLV